MILESIVTTVSLDGTVNISPMGPIVEPPRSGQNLPTFEMRPYEGSQTCRNLMATGKAVIHVTDDVLLLARAAIGQVDPDGLVCDAEGTYSRYTRLIDCHRWYAVEVTRYGGTPPRHELLAVCEAEGVVRPFFGFNRAKHAVIEAAILATRIDRIDADTIQAEMQRLRIPVEKTAGADEREAFELIEAMMNRHFQTSGADSV